MSSFIQWRCTQVLEMFADRELVGNCFSDKEKKLPLRVGLLNSSQLLFKVKRHFQTDLEQDVSFCDQSCYRAL